tara:strand:- start:861 stop:1439 length:579 start_codon:yes stop_codon:yes gene_type:complete
LRIYLLRHTSLNIKPDIFYGQSDVDVSENFSIEVKNIKKKILNKKIELKSLKVYSSPLIRCVKLADSIFDDFHLDDRLKELDFGDWEMKKVSEIDDSEIKEWQENLLDFQIPGGESNKEFLRRISSFCNDVVKKDENIFIVAHAGSINCIISYLSGIPFNKLIKDNWKKISYGSITSLVRSTENFKIDFFGI